MGPNLRTGVRFPSPPPLVVADCALFAAAFSFHSKPPLTRSVAPPLPSKPADFEGVGTAEEERMSRTALCSRRLFLFIQSRLLHAPSLPLSLQSLRTLKGWGRRRKKGCRGLSSVCGSYILFHVKKTACRSIGRPRVSWTLSRTSGRRSGRQGNPPLRHRLCQTPPSSADGRPFPWKRCAYSPECAACWPG